MRARENGWISPDDFTPPAKVYRDAQFVVRVRYPELAPRHGGGTVRVVEPSAATFRLLRLRAQFIV